MLNNGGLILYPTDTVWGLGCDACNPAAVEKIFKIKKRAESKSLIVLMAEERSLLQYVAAPDPAIFEWLETIGKPTTVIYNDVIGLAENILASDGSAGIRIVKDEFCKHLIKRFRKPIVSTSANISGFPSPALYTEIATEIKDAVDYIVRYRQDDNKISPPSTIIKWENGNRIVIRP